VTLSIKGLAGASAVFWGGSILIVGILNLLTPGYGNAFLEICSSLYPGYKLAGTWSSVLIATGYGLVDGAVCGAVFAWLYNLFVPATQ
jgi:hypothetical protein